MDRSAAPSSTLVLAVLLAIALPAAAERAPAPSPRCADARSVQEVVQSDDYTLALRTADESRFRVDLAMRCPGIADEPGLKLVSPGGWTCGRAHEAVVAGPRVCPIANVARIDPRTFASHAMAAVRAGSPGVLDSVAVQGKRRRGFVGSPAYCVNTNHMRSWSEDAEGLIVEVSPIRSGGNRYYRVELGAGCRGLQEGAELTLATRVGGAMVCGFAGDEAIFSGDGGLSRALLPDNTLRAPLDANRCPVSEVYPLDPEAEREVAIVTPAR